MNNWYKIAIKGTYTILAGELARSVTYIILNSFKGGITKNKLEQSIYCKSINKNIAVFIDVDINLNLQRAFFIGGKYYSDPTYKNDRVVDSGKEEVSLKILINPNIVISQNDLYQELFYVIRHEMEHGRDTEESKLDLQELLNRERYYRLLDNGLNSENIIEVYRASVDYLLYHPEIEPFLRSIAYSSKKRGKKFEQFLNEKINEFLYGNDNNIRNIIVQNLGEPKVKEAENRIANNFLIMHKNIFQRTNKKSFNLYNVIKGI